MSASPQSKAVFEASPASADFYGALLQDAVASERYAVKSASLAVSVNDDTKQFQVGCAPHDLWEVASLSKSVGTAFAFEYFAKHSVDMSKTLVNTFLAQLGASFRVKPSLELMAAADESIAQSWADRELTLEHLCSHSGLNMHYVKGVPADREGGMLSTAEYLVGNEFNPQAVSLIFRPGTSFKYSGAGYILLQHILELHSGKTIAELTRPFLDALGMQGFTFEVNTIPGKSYVNGKKDDGTVVEGGRKMFPAFAAGGMSTIQAMQQFCVMLGKAYRNSNNGNNNSNKEEGSTGPISHATAQRMLAAHDRDMSFMGCHIGVGIFVLLSRDGSNNRFMLHQGANDGFRVLCFHCFDGVDAGKGFTICCAGDELGVLFNVSVARQVVLKLGFSGVQAAAFGSLPDLKTEGLKQEEIVNIGYRDNLFHAFRTAAK